MNIVAKIGKHYMTFSGSGDNRNIHIYADEYLSEEIMSFKSENIPQAVKKYREYLGEDE